MTDRLDTPRKKNDIPLYLSDLRPGDCLLYSGSGLFSFLIKVKSFSRVSHTEVYIGAGRAIASRDGQGVDNYPLRTKGLVEVLRPNEPFDLNAALQWYGTVRGAKYDVLQLFVFLSAGRKQLEDEKAFFCSELASAFYRKGGFFPFAQRYPTCAVTPGMFRSSPHLDVIWSRL